MNLIYTIYIERLKFHTGAHTCILKSEHTGWRHCDTALQSFAQELSDPFLPLKTMSE